MTNPAIGDETYLRGDANADSSIRILWVADGNGDGLPDAKIQSRVGGAWRDIVIPLTVPDASLPGQAVNKAQLDAVAAAAASPPSAAAVPFTPAGTGAVATTVAAKLGETVSVKDFGAAGDDSTDDTAAFERALAYAIGLGGITGTLGLITIVVPRGLYKVTKPVLSYKTSAGLHGQVRWVGQGAQVSVLKLYPPSAAEAWLYDSSGSYAANGVSGVGGYGGQSYQFAEFHGIGFEGGGTNSAFASAFNIYSTGNEQGFKFHNCRLAKINSMRRGIVCTGSANASEMFFAATHFGDFNTAVYTLDNPQAVNHYFLDCHMENVTGTLFLVTTNGGGTVHCAGGSYIWGSGGSKGWLIDIAGSGNVNSRFVFESMRTEQHQGAGETTPDLAGLVRKTNTSGWCEIDFNKCDFNGNGGALTVEGVRIDYGCKVVFAQCRIPSNWTYRLLETGGADYTSPNAGIVSFRDCVLPSSLSAAVTFDNRYGSVHARGCTLDSGSEAEAVNFDLNIRNLGRHGVDIPIKRAPLKPSELAWPNTDVGNEYTCLLPYNARVVGIRVYKPASGSSTATYQLHVGTDDKATTWATSTSAQYQVAHVINTSWDASQWIALGTTLTARRVRLWASANGDATTQVSLANEQAWVEYI